MKTQTLNKTQQLLSYFEEAELGGNAFYVLTNDAPDEVRELVRELHDDELPNNWRFDVIVSLLDAFDAGTEYGQAVDDCVDVYNSDLLQWLELMSQSYIEEAREEGLIEEDANLWQRIQAGQWFTINNMAMRLLEEVEG